MITDSNYERVYSGSEINANYLKTYLEDSGIKSILRNDKESALRGGFGNYESEVLLFVEKENLIKAKHLVEKAFAEEQYIDSELEAEASQSRLEEEGYVSSEGRPLIQKGEKPQRSKWNLLINAALLIYSLWRLYPLTQGEDLSTFRIFLSGFIAAISAFALINHFRK
ncbi:putative signal transducing protein [Leeuwenhoekiella sp. H156]|uniref:putative signal transducing protein n=1 Tax=Leeuwenhoekiella sp. H156 TaxID=3450128 RepID=UPI003FA44B91